MFHFGLKRCVRAQLTECVGIKTLSQRYMTVAYTGEVKGDQQNNLTKCFILHHYCKKHFLRTKCTSK